MNYNAPFSSQLYVPAVFLGVGFLLGVLFELCRFVRLLFVIKTVAAIRVQDVVFCLLSFLIFFFALLGYSDGKPRLHLLLAVFAGFAAFRLTAATLLRKALVFLCAILQSAAQTILRPLTRIERRLSAFGKNRVKKRGKMKKTS